MPPTPLEVFGAGKFVKLASSVMLWLCVAMVLMGGGGWQLFPTEFGKLCVPLKKSWLRPCENVDRRIIGVQWSQINVFR